MSITLAIVIITCIISIMAFSNQKIMNDLIFYPPAISEHRQYYRFITNALIHADIPHLAFNMIALYSFGSSLEFIFSMECLFGPLGKVIYIILYVVGAIAAILPTYQKNKDNYYYRSLGASGAVSAVLFAGLVIVPQLPIRFMFIPIDIPGFIFGPIYLGISAYLDKRGNSNINHSAHFWGAAFGFLFTLVLCITASHLSVLENFIEQIKSTPHISPIICK